MVVVCYDTNLPGQWYFYGHGHDLGQQAAVERGHEGSGIVVWEDQRHLQETRGLKPDSMFSVRYV